MVAELDALGVKLMVSIWPTVNPAAETYDEMERRGLLVRAERGMPSHMVFTDVRADGPVHLRYYDATHPEARRFIWERVREGYYRHGVKVWWLDACEPEVYPPDHENLRYHLGNGLEVAGLYPLLHQQALLRGDEGRGGGRRRDPLPLGVGRQPALWRGGLVGRHRLHVRGAAARRCAPG